MNLLESLKMALDSIKSNKLRSFLTMLGIIIGISSVIIIVSLGKGGKANIVNEFEKMGVNNVTIAVDVSKAKANEYITLKDIEVIKDKIVEIKYISPLIQKKGVIASDTVSKSVSITGGSEELTQANNYNILYGRYFNESEVLNEKAVAVIDENTANQLFGYSDVVGKNIKIGSENSSKNVMIVGVRESINMGPNKERLLADVPITFMQSIYTDTNKIYSVTVTATSKDEALDVGSSAINILESRHYNREMGIYNAESMIEKLSQINTVMDTFTTFIAAVAGISLLVGGIGVMNIMLVSVTERTREIGIRKAIGAKTKHILIQFLSESSIIAAIGGVIGLIIGITVSLIIGTVIKIVPVFSVLVIIGVILFSSAIGIFFGIYPAKKAAALNPIEALRYE